MKYNIIFITVLIVGLLSSYQSCAQQFPYYSLDSIRQRYPNCFDGQKTYDCQEASWEMSFVGAYRENHPYVIETSQF